MQFVKQFVLRKLDQETIWFLQKLRAQTWPVRGSLKSLARGRRSATKYCRTHSQDMFFVLGYGRSGTLLLTKLFSQANNATVYHEPNFLEDIGCFDQFRCDPDLARKYLKRFRTGATYERWVASGKEVYGEVNGTIRYLAPVLNASFPQAKLYLLSRDGRGVVRSVMGWPRFWAPGAKGAHGFAPLKGDPYGKQWEKMDRFERVCWSWMDTYELLIKHIPKERWIRLEDFVTDFDYAKRRIIDPMHLDLSRSTWREVVSKPSSNATKRYAFPKWQDWSPQQQQAFRRICGDTMTKLGYDMTKLGYELKQAPTLHAEMQDQGGQADA